MPYVRCPRCGDLTYSAARWSSVEECSRCEHQLPRRPPTSGLTDRRFAIDEKIVAGELRRER
jgi:hypothetical protein